MDIVEEIKKQVTQLKSDGHSSYVNQVVVHLDRAELYYKKGEEDDNYFNDVVYRTNQAYEGALKEAYKVLGDKIETQVIKSSPNEIEIYLKEQKIFKERVLTLLENYRKEWRNKSTHDYKLVFDQSEAFMALTNVSSFVHLLLKQLQEKIAFEKELKRQETDKEKKEIHDIVADKKDTLVNKVLKLLTVFMKEIESKTGKLNEAEINGRLMAFLTKSDSELIIHREPNYTIGTRNVRPDFYIQSQNEKLLIEVNRILKKRSLLSHVDQLITYLNVSGVDQGVSFPVLVHFKSRLSFS
jgi:hypothetical protein